MLRTNILRKYVFIEYSKLILKITLLFFGLGIIINLFEEINFFKDLDVSFNIPIVLSLMFVPSMLHNFFPFVVLLSGLWFFLKIKKRMS